MRTAGHIEAPTPGDLIVAMVDMRSWENDEKRGTHGEYINMGDTVLVISTWRVGNHVRLRVANDSITLLFSCREHVVNRNWNIVARGTERPA